MSKQAVLKPEQYEQLSEAEKTEASKSDPAFQKLQETAKLEVQRLKKRLKTHSKSELILLTLQQAAKAQEFQELSQRLYEDNKKLIEEIERLKDQDD